MDGFTLTAEIFKALAWPVCIVVIVFLTRDDIKSVLSHIKEVLSQLTKIKFKDFEAYFSKDFTEAEITADSEQLPPAGEANEVAVATTEPAFEKLKRLAEELPVYAIAEAWIDVKFAVDELIDVTINRDGNRRYSYVGGISELYTAYKITNGDRKILKALLEGRNYVIHNGVGDITTEHAIRYATLATRMVARLNQLIKDAKAEAEAE